MERKTAKGSSTVILSTPFNTPPVVKGEKGTLVLDDITPRELSITDDPNAPGKIEKGSYIDQLLTNVEKKANEDPRSLGSYLEELHEKIDENYAGDIGDNRFTLREWSMIF